MAITTLNNRAINRSDTASADQLWTATSATATDFQAAAAGGKVAQIVQATDKTARTTTSSSAVDVSTTLIAQITPAATSSKILVTVQTVCESPTYGWAAYLYKDVGGGGYANVDGTERFLEVAGVAKQASGVIISYLDSPSTTSQVSYRPYFSITGGGTLTVGYGSDTISTIQAMEITA